MAKKPAKSKNVNENLTLSKAKAETDRIVKVTAKSEEQKLALKNIHENKVTFLIGPPGTGKSHLAVGYGLQELKRGNFERIIFTRPCVEAGEKLGAMPGDVDAKMANFMIPMYEVVREYFDEDDIEDMVDDRRIVVLPFAFMRGVNFKNAYVCADEVQNSTPSQMHLLLTRLCEGSKIVLTGDIKQSDLRYQVNGLVDAIRKLQNIDDLSFVELTYASCVRDKIVNDIDARYRIGSPDAISISDILADHRVPKEPTDVKPHVDDRRGTLYED
jgi:phosphate starvation-inducible PhoH-like protein